MHVQVWKCTAGPRLAQGVQWRHTVLKMTEVAASHLHEEKKLRKEKARSHGGEALLLSFDFFAYIAGLRDIFVPDLKLDIRALYLYVQARQLGRSWQMRRWPEGFM